ncbi:hypothetical protein, variant [Aphanomyces astaci]|uniref:Spindle assembly checkpoint component MAD1 n=1 Tax=Aphanomyces astaci TaxID=112090 RepID=W4HAR5_APHAT|nr:hypothetical protein, variant [Aphanomyces astaci]ETV88203.1 hypothetical protein, variant [Aphanomyces astaci]|eukprot:XP_009823066.1 hypothetical protein, variant [Aphanomyces astaci]
MEKTGGGYQSLMESTRELSPIPHADAPAFQLETSSITLGSASETGPDEGIPMTAEWSDESRELKRGRDASDDAVVGQHGEEQPRSAWYTRKLEEKVQSLTNDLVTANGSEIGGNVMQSSSLSGFAAKRRRTEGENAALTRVEMLRRELEAERLLEARLRHKHEMEMADKDAELEKLKRRLKLTMTEEEETQTKLRRATTEVFELRQAQQALRIEHDAALHDKDDELEELMEHLRAMEEASKAAANEARQTISSLEDKLALVAVDTAPSPLKTSVAQSELRLLREQLAEKTIQATNAVEQLKAADATLKEANDIRDHRRRVADLEHAEAKHLDELRQLRHQLKGHAALEEKVASLYRAQEASERQLQEAFSMRASYDDLVAEKKQWQATFEPLFADPNKGVSKELATERPAQAICELFSSQQHDLETLVDERHQLESQVKALHSTIDAMTKRNVTLESTVAQLEAADADRTEKADAASRTALRLHSTNADLIALLKSFESTGSSDEHVALVQQLETALKNAEDTIQSLQSTQQALPSPALLAKIKRRVAEVEEALGQEKAASLHLRTQLEQAQATASLVERRLAKGPVNLDSTKVLQLNPALSATKQKLETAEMLELRRENDRLKEIVQNLNPQTPGGPKMPLPTPMKTSASSSHDSVEGLQKMNQRLKEVFREQIAKYRDAVYQCTGYKVDLKYPELVLRSIYAENEGDEVKFQFNNGELELLETPFVAGLDQRNMAYLTMCNSIPAFLSGVTLALFEKQTYQAN